MARGTTRYTVEAAAAGHAAFLPGEGNNMICLWRSLKHRFVWDSPKECPGIVRHYETLLRQKSKGSYLLCTAGDPQRRKDYDKNVKRFGKHSELLKVTDDPLAYVKAEIKKMNEEYRVGKASHELKVDFNERVAHSSALASSPTWVNIGYLMIQYIMSGLELKDFFKEITKGRKNTFDCYTIMRFLTYARILDPASKHATWGKLGTYYEKPNFEYQHILRCIDILSEHYSKYIEWLFRKSNNVVERNTSVMYYDCTNFYCECESADEDYIDKVTGEFIEGLRRFGCSKEHRPIK